MALEKIVRPYQTREFTPSVRLQIANQVDPQPVKLQIGRSSGGGNPKVLTGSYSYSAQLYLEKTAVEKKRS